MMRFLIKIFSSLLILHYVVTSSDVEFSFTAIPLGHSGLLITWKPNITMPSDKSTAKDYQFLFKKYIIEENNHANVTGNDHQSHGSAGQNNEFNETGDGLCLSSAEQYKIHSLKENIFYEIIVQQYHEYPKILMNGSTHTSYNPFLRKYSVKMRTTLKSQKIPEKPDFEFFPLSRKIRWYPCGKERVCHDNQRSGTHFGITIKEPYNTKRLIEVSKEEFYSTFMYVFLLAGRLYEIVVFSVNGELKTDSDPKEIFLKPLFTAVQYVHVISLPDLSVLISWKPPKQSQNASLRGCAIFNINNSKPKTDKRNQFIVHDEVLYSIEKSEMYATNDKIQQIRIPNLNFESVYDVLIIPVGEDGAHGFGFEYYMKYQLQVHNHDLPIAKPDFICNYEIIRIREETISICRYYFQWLPCGQSFNCENTKPGANYSFEFSSTPLDQDRGDEFGYSQAVFHINVEFSVSVTSFIGNYSSKSEIKYFKDCNEI